MWEGDFAPDVIDEENGDVVQRAVWGRLGFS